jgi:poly-gamma-glutamate capsule biosynthesis protein CapA/YwtB (metallophosphatase superfamily)
MNRFILLCLTLAWLALAGCQSQESKRPPGDLLANQMTDTQPEPSATIVSQPTAVSPAPGFESTATRLPPSATPTPSPTASVTPRPVVRLSVPDRWQSDAAAAITELKESGSGWQWQLVPHGEPADINLQAGEEGIPAGHTPLALAVPWISEWTTVSLADAQNILANGHELVTIVDWVEIEPNQKPLIIDGLRPRDVGYPLQQPWSLVAQPSFEAATGELANLLSSKPATEPLIHLAAVGDVMLDRALGYAINQGYLDYPFSKVAPLLQTADFTIGNLECALGDTGLPESKSYTFQAPPAAAESLARAGFDLVSLANNHAMDYGPESLQQGIQLLAQQGIGVIGAGANAVEARKPYTTTIQGLRLAFLAYVHVPVEWRGFDTELWTATETEPGLAWAVPEQITADVQAASQQADLVIVVLHSGWEYVIEPSFAQVAAAYAAIDAGAALVIGHHAHILQGVQFHNGGVIVYGLGNFAFEIDEDPSTAILNVWLDRSGVRQLELVPAVIQFGGQPRLAESWEAQAILRPVYRQTFLMAASPPKPEPPQ